MKTFVATGVLQSYTSGMIVVWKGFQGWGMERYQ